jgi:hypothetical protein
MTAFQPYYIPQYRTTTLDLVGGMTNATTAGIKLATIPSDLDITKPGILAFTYSNPIDASLIEWITYTSIDGTNVLQGVTRGAEGWGAKSHDNGCTIGFVFSKSHVNEIMDALTGVTTGVILNIPSLTTPKITTSINDANGNEVIKTPATGSAVNEITVTNAATNGTPTISATGGDTDISLDIVSKGAGVIKFNSKAVSGFDGWTPVTDSWTYASASTINVPSGAAAIYGKGDRIRFKQGAGYKYFVIVAVTDTLLTVAINTDYTVATPTAITDIAYSHQISPIGFPQWFTAATPTFAVSEFDNGSGGQPTTTSCRMSINGNICTLKWCGSGTKATTDTYVLISAHTFPTPANMSQYQCMGVGHVGLTGVYYPWNVMYNSAASIYLITQANINDNTTITIASFVLSYEF